MLQFLLLLVPIVAFGQENYKLYEDYLPSSKFGKALKLFQTKYGRYCIIYKIRTTGIFYWLFGGKKTTPPK